MIKIALSLFGSYLACKTYDEYVAPEEKNNWESTIKMHHGEIGVLLIIAGILLFILGSVPTSLILIAAGLGLAIHDRNDMPKWFKSHPFRT